MKRFVPLFFILALLFSLSFSIEKGAKIINTPSVNIQNDVSLAENTAITINQILNSPDVKALSYGAISSDTWRQIRIDASTHSLQTIGYEHHEIHAGSHFYLSGFEVGDDGDDVVFSVTTTDNAKWAHMTFEVAGTSRTEFMVYEDSASTGGVSALPLNNNRNSDNASAMIIAKNPTVTVTGNLIYSETRGLEGTNKIPAIGGLISRVRELILKQDTTYLFVITSRDDDNNVSYVGEWYEHTEKN